MAAPREENEEDDGPSPARLLVGETVIDKGNDSEDGAEVIEVDRLEVDGDRELALELEYELHKPQGVELATVEEVLAG